MTLNKKYIEKEILPLDSRLSQRGIGLIRGVDCSKITEFEAISVVKKAFAKGLVLELAGRKDCVLKILPPLTIEDDLLLEGLGILKNALAEAFSEV